MQFQFLVLLATIATALAIPTPIFRQESGSGAPGRVLTKTFTYDSTKDFDDPCNPVTGDPERCLRSMEQPAPTPNSPSADRLYVAEQLDAAQHNAEDSDFDILYQRGTKKYLPAGY